MKPFSASAILALKIQRAPSVFIIVAINFASNLSVLTIQETWVKRRIAVEIIELF